MFFCFLIESLDFFLKKYYYTSQRMTGYEHAL